MYNQWEYTLVCLQSLKENTPREDVQVIVVDNGSSDETPAQCPSLGRGLFGPRFEYIRLEENINFGPGCNLGASYAHAEFLFFLNNDTKCTPGWLEPLLNAFNGKTGAVGPLLLYPESNLVQHLGISFTPTNNLVHLHHCIPGASPLAQKQRKVQALTAAALLIPANIFARFGGFHEEYKNGYEDIDLCLSLGREGYKLKCIPESRIYHYTSKTAGRFDRDEENSRKFMHRAVDLVVADTHVHARKDGLRIGFNELLQLYYRLDEAKNRELFVWAENEEAGEVLKTLVRHPYWEEGYNLVQKWYGNDPYTAYNILHAQSLYFPLKYVYARLSKVAHKIGEKAQAESCMQEIREMGRYPGTEEYMNRLNSVRMWATRQNDSRLMRIYREMRAFPSLYESYPES